MFAERIKALNPYVPGEQPKDKVYIKFLSAVSTCARSIE